MEHEYKTVTLCLKKDKLGAFSVVFSTLNVVDHDKDVTLPGAFPTGKEIVMSSYQHGSWQGGIDALPPGKGVINEKGNQVIADGEFNLNSMTGKEHYETVKFLGGLQEYSYGFKPVEWEMGEFDGQEVRFLKKVDIFEFSPVLKGAGIGTQTLAIKNDKTTYADEAESVLAAVSNLAERTKSLADVRRKEGRDLSDTNRERIKKLLDSLSVVATDLKGLLNEPDKALIASLTAIKEKIKFYGGN